MGNKLVINASTGVATRVPLSSAEEAELAQRAVDHTAKLAADNAAETAKQGRLNSLRGKLGLTPAEFDDLMS